MLGMCGHRLVIVASLLLVTGAGGDGGRERAKCLRKPGVRERIVEPEQVVLAEGHLKVTNEDEVVRYSGHRLFRMKILSETHLRKLRSLQRSWSVKGEAGRQLEFWDEPLQSGQEVTIRVAPSALKSVEKTLRSANVTYSTLTEDLQKWIDKEAKENVPDEDGLGLRDGELDLGMYHTLKEINESLVTLHQRHRNNTRLLVLGKTAEGRQITGIRIGTGEPTRPAIFIDGAMHAREWISPASILYLTHRLLDNTEEDPKTEGMTDRLDWYIFPVVNPDGYEYSWSSNRLWRKNRRRTLRFARFCRGVDPNRNFGTQFGRRGSSANPCAENYGGTAAFSENESRAVKDGVLRLKDRLVAYLNVHSYSQVLMSPYGHTKEKPSAYDDQEAAMKAFTDGLRKPFNATYRFGTAAGTMYHTSGAAIDWVHDVAKVKHSMVIELRDKGQYGFILPREFIIPSGMELVQGFRDFIDHLDKQKELVVSRVNPDASW